MGDNEIRISPEQARTFAYAIYRDIAAYVESHQEEYQKFTSTEEDAFNDKGMATHRPKRGKQKTNRE